jgi:hypothetical protein
MRLAILAYEASDGRLFAKLLAFKPGSLPPGSTKKDKTQLERLT